MCGVCSTDKIIVDYIRCICKTGCFETFYSQMDSFLRNLSYLYDTVIDYTGTSAQLSVVRLRSQSCL
jgi:hypothetical protein